MILGLLSLTLSGALPDLPPIHPGPAAAQAQATDRRAGAEEPGGPEERGHLRGTVREADTTGGPGIAAARLVLEGPVTRSRVARWDGRFEFRDLPAASYELRVEHLGYRPIRQTVEIPGDDGVVRLDVWLYREPIALDPLEVEVERRAPMGPVADAYERVEHMRLLGLGRFLTREEIEARPAVSIRFLIRSMVPGGRVSRFRWSLYGCSGPVLYVDGRRMRGVQIDCGPGCPTERVDDHVHVDDVELIEVYRGPAQLPAEFSGSTGQCGVVNITTRRGQDLSREVPRGERTRWALVPVAAAIAFYLRVTR